MASAEPKVYPATISRRERSILFLIAEGYENREIADELYISEKTVTGTQDNLMRKLKASNVSSVIDHALKNGWISVYEILESRFSKRNL